MRVLGEMLIDPGAAATIQGILRPEDFQLDRHKILYTGILACLGEHGDADILVLQDLLDRKGLLNRVGGPVYISELLDGVISTVNAEAHATLVLEESQMRTMSRGARQILEQRHRGQPLHELVGTAQKLLFDLRGPRVSGQHEDLADVLNRSLDAIDARARSDKDIPGIPSGVEELDRLTLGFHKDEMSIVAARPSHGKTAMMLHMALAAAKAGHRVAIQSLEMSGISLADRLITSEARVPGQGIRSGRLSRQETDRVAEAAFRLHDLPITIDESTGQTIHDIRAKIRNLKARHRDLDLYMIDYVQLLKATGALESSQKEQALASAVLKDIARELHIAVVALSQVKRPQQGTEYRRPFLSDLKESGTWEQDADAVVIIHRPEKADFARAKKEDRLGVCEIWLEKQRNGPTGNFEIEYVKSELSFRSLDRGRAQGPPLEEEQDRF